MKDRYEKIEAYLGGQLSESEARAFEQDLVQDAGLQEELNAHLLARDAIEVAIADSLRETLKTWRGEEKTTKVNTEGPRIRTLWRRNLAIAASVLVLIVAGSFWWANSRYSDSAIAGRFYSAADLASLRNGPAEEEPLAPGTQLILQGDYPGAIQFFNEALMANENNVEARCYRGQAHFLQGDLDAAEADLRLVVQNSIHKNLQEKAEWVLALVYLKQGNDSQWQPLIEKMASNPEHNYHPNAVNLQASLHSGWRILVK